jgi:hypothetical protein
MEEFFHVTAFSTTTHRKHVKNPSISFTDCAVMKLTGETATFENYG